MNVVFFGSDGIGLPVLDALADSHTVVAVVTAPDRPRGRGLRLLPTPVKEWAVQRGVPALQFEAIDADAVSRVGSFAPDLCVVFSYGLILPRAFLSVPRLAFLNIHPSLLPRYRGAAPMEWALIKGEKKTGVTVAAVAPEVDSGDIYCQEEFPLADDDTIVTLREKVSQLAPRLLLSAIALVEEGRRPRPQAGKPSYARKLTKKDGWIPWAKSAQEVHNLCRGVLIWPGAMARLDTPKGRKLLKLYETAVEDPDGSFGRPGEVVEADRRLLVACGKGLLRVSRIQMEGKAVMPAEAFLKGTVIPRGSVLYGQ